MRILVDPGILELRNKGNIALIQVALSRLQNLWPDADFKVITITPHITKYYFPFVDPVRPDGLVDNSRVSEVLKFLPKQVMRILLELREIDYKHLFPLEQSIKDAARVVKEENHKTHLDRIRDDGKDKNVIDEKKYEFIKKNDLYITSGAQYMSDNAKEQALDVLNRIEYATKNRIPTIMVGQGFGPMEDASLKRRAREVLPQVDYIFVREKKIAYDLLQGLGINPSKIIYTGDDAMELAYNHRSHSVGTGIGIGWRIGSTTEVDYDHLKLFRKIIHESATKYDAKLVAVPISLSKKELDTVLLREILRGYPRQRQSFWKFQTPLDMIKIVGRCRLVISSTFHPIIFALAQGIPAIGLAKTSLYVNKFEGILDQFNDGFEVISFDDRQFSEKLCLAIDKAWNNAPLLKPKLTEVAGNIIASGKEAYTKIYELVEGL